jgi:brefeldin A-inhibited guanine nucleotide-exchange protein
VKPIIVADMLSTAGAKTSLADISGMTAAVQGFLNNVVAAAGYGAAVETPEQLKQSVAAAIGPRHSMELTDSVAAAAAATTAAAAPAAGSGSGGSDGGMAAAAAAAAVTEVSSSDEEEDEKNTFHLAPATSSDVAAVPPAAAAAGSNGAAAAGPAAAGSNVRDAAAKPHSSAASTGHAAAAPGAAAAAAAAAAASVSQGRALLLKDAFLVFRALCKLSIRTSDSVTITDPTAVRGKVRGAAVLPLVCF